MSSKISFKDMLLKSSNKTVNVLPPKLPEKTIIKKTKNVVDDTLDEKIRNCCCWGSVDALKKIPVSVLTSDKIDRMCSSIQYKLDEIEMWSMEESNNNEKTLTGFHNRSTDLKKCYTFLQNIKKALAADIKFESIDEFEPLNNVPKYKVDDVVKIKLSNNVYYVKITRIFKNTFLGEMGTDKDDLKWSTSFSERDIIHE